MPVCLYVVCIIDHGDGIQTSIMGCEAVATSFETAVDLAHEVSRKLMKGEGHIGIYRVLANTIIPEGLFNSFPFHIVEPGVRRIKGRVEPGGLEKLFTPESLAKKRDAANKKRDEREALWQSDWVKELAQLDPETKKQFDTEVSEARGPV